MSPITLNGDPTDLEPGATVADAVARLDLPAGARGVAVAVDAEVVPRGQWASTPLAAGARVEVLHAVQGG